MCTSPIFAYGIQLLQGLHEALSIEFVGLFDTKVIDNKSNDKIRGGLFPKSRCDWHRGAVAMWGMEGSEAIVGYPPSLGEAIHSFADFHIDMIMMHEW
jgi:hypothetical protein